jgi:NTP pyrophosphatase (non-canonical NTP hydrolase)
MFMPRSFAHACEDYWIYDLESHLYIREDGTLRNKYPKRFKTEQEAQDFLNKWLPNGYWYGSRNEEYFIDWLTQEHIQEQAELGDKEALDCSIEHWKQIVVAGWDVFYTAYRRGKVNIYSNYCALCERFKLPSPYIGTKCSNCTIATKAGVSGCSDTPHGKARIAFDRRDRQAFESAAVEELNFLIELRNGLFGNPYLTTELETKINETEYKSFVNKLRNDDLNCSDVVLIHGVLGIAGESGELVDIVKKHLVYHGELDVEHLKEELGDLLHYMTYLLIKYNWSLSDLMSANIKKLRKRYPNGYSDEDALARRDKLKIPSP